MDDMDRKIINRLQGGFPVSERPYAEAAAEMGLSERNLMARIRRLLGERALSRFGPMFDTERMGGAVTLAAMAVPKERFDAVAEIVNASPEVAHNYAREHKLNMWFVIAVEAADGIASVIARIEAETGLEVFDMPKTEEYFLELKLNA